MEADTVFNVTLKNTPVYSRETMRWLAGLESFALSGNQKHLLAYAKEHGSAITRRAYQNLMQIDTETAMHEIRELIKLGLVSPPRKGGRVYELSSPSTLPQTPKPDEYLALEPILEAKGFIKNQDIQLALKVAQVQASRIATRLVDAGWLRPEGDFRTRTYYATRKDT